MLRSIFPIIITCSLIFTVPIAALAEPGPEQQNVQPDKLSEVLTSALSHIADFEITLHKEDHFTAYSFLKKDIKEIHRYTFQSKKPISKNSSKKTYLRFELSVMHYKTVTSAKTALEALLASVDPNIGLSYAWDYVLNVDIQVYWLSAPCLLSEQNWQKLKSQLQKYSLSKESAQHLSFECRCGLNCRRDGET